MKQLKAVQKMTTEDPELADRFNRTLAATVEAMEESGLRYAFIGGIASGGLGRPRSTHDIDLFVVPEEAELALRALAKKGFRTEKTDPSWLYKGFKDGILVDIIFKSKGEIYFDNEMYRRTIIAEFHGKKLRLVAPEDLLIIKAAAHSELTPNHWHDATALLSHATLDWQYLLKRARRAPRRVLSLLLYAQSNDIGVPNHVISELYNGIFGNPVSPQLNWAHYRPAGPAPEDRNLTAGAPAGQQPGPTLHAVRKPVVSIARLRERLAEDPRTHELDIQLEQSGDKVLLRGQVQTEERREAVEQIARESCPQATVENQIQVSHFDEQAPIGSEEVK